MSFEIKISKRLIRTLEKLKRKDIALFRRVQKKINQIGGSDEISIQHFKNLRHDASNYKRIHIGHFVLFFEVKRDRIIFDRFVHHDDAY